MGQEGTDLLAMQSSILGWTLASKFLCLSWGVLRGHDNNVCSANGWKSFSTVPAPEANAEETQVRCRAR